jgi:hypothetical protein
VPGWASMLAVPLCGTALRCSGQLRWLRNSRPSGTQTCLPSPCLQQGANLSRPAHLRRQQGAHPGTASALVTPLMACHNPAVAVCQHLPTATVMACHNLQRWRATSGAKKGWAGIWLGALLVLRSTVSRWARDSALRHHACRGCLSAAGAVSVASSPALPRREHRKEVPLQAGPPTMKPGRMLAQPSPRVIPTKRTALAQLALMPPTQHPSGQCRQ